jgi:hypothetical protein
MTTFPIPLEEEDNQILENCTLEWNRECGVLYIHHLETGCTVLHICGLRRRPIPDPIMPGQPIDVTIRDGRAYVQYPNAQIGG